MDKQRCLKPIIFIDVSLSNDNYIMGNRKLSQLVVYYDKAKKKGKMITNLSMFCENLMFKFNLILTIMFNDY